MFLAIAVGLLMNVACDICCVFLGKHEHTDREGKMNVPVNWFRILIRCSKKTKDIQIR